MSSRKRQPPIELAVGAPLVVRDRDDGATVVGIWTREGWRELKRIEN